MASRSRPSCTIGCLGAILLSIVPALIGFYTWDRQTSLTAAAPAEVVRLFNSGTRSDQNRRTTIDYRYTVEGQVYEARFMKRGPNVGLDRFKEGQPAKVCYNPNRPQVSEPFPPEYRCPDSRWPKFLRQPAKR